MASVRSAGVARLAAGLDQRRGLMGGAAQEGLDRQLLHAFSRLRRLAVGGFDTAIDGLVTRQVALPLACALASQPHLSSTLNPMAGTSAQRRDGVVMVAREQRRDVLRLQLWEIDEFIEEVDRLASLHLRQVRAVRWLWDHYGANNPQELVRRLMLGAPNLGHRSVTTRGSRVYVVVGSARRSSPHTVFVPWLAPVEDERSLSMSTFDGRFVDGSLREALGRALGANDAEVVALLDHIVCLMPADDPEERIDRDEWRSGGASVLTGLAHNIQAAFRSVEPLVPTSIRTEGWLDMTAGRLRLGNAETAFEALAIKRVARASRLVHAAFIARFWAGVRRPLDGEDLELLDVRHHVATVLQPMLGWAANPATAQELARQNGVDVSVYEQALKRVHERWTVRYERWVSLPTENDPWPPVARLLDQLVRFVSVLESLLDRAPMAARHGDLFLLYAAHRISGASELDLMPLDPDVSGIPEAMATELWGAWKALMTDSAGPNKLLKPA